MPENSYSSVVKERAKFVNFEQDNTSRNNSIDAHCDHPNNNSGHVVSNPNTNKTSSRDTGISLAKRNRKSILHQLRVQQEQFNSNLSESCWCIVKLLQQHPLDMIQPDSRSQYYSLDTVYDDK
jgi:hypothetical protein